MGDGTEFDDALLGLRGFRVLAVTEDGDELLVGIENCVNRLMDGAFGEAPHPQQPLLEFFQIVFEMSFHFSSVNLDAAGPLDSRLNSHAPILNSHPNRPVMYASVRGSVGVVNSLDVSLCSINLPSSMNAV